MKTKTLLSTLLLCFSFIVFSQSEPLNQLDSAGKKHGKWIRYLNKQWKVVTDSNKAVYFRYTFYDHGINIHPMGRGGGKNWKMESTPGISLQKNKIKMLDGTYKWYDKKGRLIFEHVLKNGEYVYYKEYYKSGQLQTFFDYTKQFPGQPHTWYMYLYDKLGNVTWSEYSKKDAKGNWPNMRG